MFEESIANNRVVLFLTDGGAVTEAKSYARKTEDETGIKVIGVGIGAGVGEVAFVYRNHVVVPKVSELPVEIGKLLTKVILENGG